MLASPWRVSRRRAWTVDVRTLPCLAGLAGTKKVLSLWRTADGCAGGRSCEGYGPSRQESTPAAKECFFNVQCETATAAAAKPMGQSNKQNKQPGPPGGGVGSLSPGKTDDAAGNTDLVRALQLLQSVLSPGEGAHTSKGGESQAPRRGVT